MTTPPSTRIRVGLSLPPAGFATHGEAVEYVHSAAEAGLDHLVTADHVAFHGGRGRDGLMTVSWLAGLHPTIGVYVGVYLLALRHPAPVARQIASLAESAPGQLILGVGVGGEDRHEIEVCGVDPATRGRRTDECLEVLRGLLSAAVRLGQTGALEARRIARALAPTLVDMARPPAPGTLPQGFSPMTDIALMRPHAARLFVN